MSDERGKPGAMRCDSHTYFDINHIYLVFPTFLYILTVVVGKIQRRAVHVGRSFRLKEGRKLVRKGFFGVGK